MQVTIKTMQILMSVLALVVVASHAAPITPQHDNSPNQPLIRTKRSDELIFDSDNNKKSDGSSVPVKNNDDKTQDTVVETSKQDSDKETDLDDHNSDVNEQSKDDIDDEDDDTDDVEEEENDEEQEQDDEDEEAGDEDGEESSHEEEDEEEEEDYRNKRTVKMVAENMAPSEQKLRAKRDLDASEIRQLLEAQREPEYYEGYAYGSLKPSDNENEDDYMDNYDTPYNDDDYSQETPIYENSDEFEKFYDEGRPKRYDEVYGDEAEREAVREILAERAAEEAREALIAYLTSGEPLPPVVPEEPKYLVDPTDEELEQQYDEEFPMLEESNEGFYEEPEVETEKRFFPYSYEPYGGRWGAVVPGLKRSDPDPYDRLYRLAEVLSRPPRLGDDGYVEKK